MFVPIIIYRWFKTNARISINDTDLWMKDDDCGGRMISVGRFLLSGGERGGSHREDTTIPTQWREGVRIPGEGYQHSGDGEEG